jgi:hypothetical protein
MVITALFTRLAGILWEIGGIAAAAELGLEYCPAGAATRNPEADRQ